MTMNKTKKQPQWMKLQSIKTDKWTEIGQPSVKKEAHQFPRQELIPSRQTNYIIKKEREAHFMNINFENIPRQMKEEGKFCLHENKIPKKRRYSKLYNASPNNRNDFSSFDSIMKDYNSIKSDKIGVGIGIFDSLCGIDLDNCFNEEGKLSELAIDILKRTKSYTEKSLSGKGLHIYFKMKPEEQIEIDKEKYYNKMNEKQLQTNGFRGTKGLEVYQGNIDNRYLTLTGNKFLQVDELKEISRDELQQILDKYMKRPENPFSKNTSTIDYSSINLEGKDYLKEALQRTDDKRDTKLIDLWNSTPSGSGGNESETDQALMNKLAYYCNKNETLMIQAFESSPYFQQKDEYHLKKWNRDDYKQSTISNAINNTNTTAIEKETDFVNSMKEREIQNQLNNQQPEVLIAKQPEEPKIDIDSLSIGKRIDRFFEIIEKQTFKSIPTGFKTFDEKTNGGFLNQSLITLGGGTSTGKTTFAINLALNFAKSRPVLYYSLEMGEEMIQAKIFSNLSYTGGGMTIPSDNFLKCYDKNIMTEYQQSKVREELAKHEELNQLFIRYPQECNIDYILKEVKLFNDELEKQGKEKAILFVDYLQYLQGNPREDSQTLIKRIQRELKKYTIENDSLVILLIANSRDADTEGKKSSISGGRDSSDIEYSSEYNLQLNFTEWERGEREHFTSRTELKRQNPRRMTITIHKNRMGMTGEMIDFNFNPVSNTFKEVNQEEKNNYYSLTDRF